jgi:dipeptidyl aminopeptidase/acylaminoacyl peptidase
MNHQSARIPFCMLVLVCLLATSALAKQPLDHDVYTQWNRIQEQGLSRDGQWAFWQMQPEEADGTLVVRSTARDATFEMERGKDAVFSHDSRHLVFLVEPTFEETRQARLDEVDEEDRPKSALGMLSLADGEQSRVERVQSFKLPEEAAGWVAYRLGVAAEKEEADDDGVEDREEKSQEDQGREDEQKPGTTLIIQSLASTASHRFDYVDEYVWAADGSRLAVSTVTPDGEGDGVWLIDPDSGERRSLMQGKGRYAELVFDDEGEQLAFLARPHDEDRAEHAFGLYHWVSGAEEARLLADESARFLGEAWHVSEHRAPWFSDSGERLFFGTAPEPVEIPDNDDRLDEEVVTVDIWHWEDELLQPMQLEQLEEERKRSYLAMAHLNDGARMVQLGREPIPEIEKAKGGDARYALGVSNKPYRPEISWDFPRYYDAWLVDMDSGVAKLVLKTVQARPGISPEGQYIHWWDRDAKTWMAMSVPDREVSDLGQGISHALEDHRNDRPFAANPYGQAGWLKDDEGFVFHDRHDVWLVHPDAVDEPRNISHGMGRERGWNVRLVDIDPNEDAIDPDGFLLATVFDEQNKDHGFYELSMNGEAPVERIVSAHRYGQPLKADEADKLLFTREDFQAFPDLWVSDSAFSDLAQLSEANPQQSDYRWGEVSLVEWQSETGKDHQGLLFKPEDFDPAREYPMIVYFYERDSDGLHNHRPPQAHRSVIIPTFYTSNDYVVFVPDTWYREGYPGDSAMESIMPKAKSLANEPWIDADRVGIQGHSWAGYKIAYMVTQTDFFRAAAGGAPVSNMTSAYGGIRWGTGMSRMFQYERTQSRLGKTLWEAPDLYLHNSPLFKADRINTPLLMMHNDQDGAVPWEQGIELFTALRRLNRPAWLVNYNDEPHWPTTFANREDWQIRLQQFFDHYLKNEPAPRWLRSGIPALEKGATLGYEKD